MAEDLGAKLYLSAGMAFATPIAWYSNNASGSSSALATVTGEPTGAPLGGPISICAHIATEQQLNAAAANIAFHRIASPR